jgi:hypothetical protein
MTQSTPPQLTLDPWLVTFWKGVYLGKHAGDAPAVSDLIPPGWSLTEAVSGPDDPLTCTGSYEGVVARREDGSVLFIDRACMNSVVTIKVAAFPTSLEAAPSSWLGERGLVSWGADLPEFPPADLQFKEDAQAALRSCSARYLRVFATHEVLFRVLHHWAECQPHVLLSGWLETPHGYVLRAALMAARSLLADEASSSPLLIVPALHAGVWYPDIRVFVHTDWAPLLVCRLAPLDATSVMLLLSTQDREFSLRLVAYLEARFRIEHLPSPWDTYTEDAHSDHSPASKGVPPLEWMRVEELVDRFRALPANIRMTLMEHTRRMSSLPEEIRTPVSAFALLAYAVDVLAAMVEDPWVGCYSVTLDQAYQTVYGILRDHASHVPGLEEAVRALPASLADWADLHELGVEDEELRQIQSQVAALAARLGRAGVPLGLVNDERTLVLGHLLGYEQALTDYRNAARARIREARRQLGLPDAPAPAEAAGGGAGDQSPKPEIDESARIIERYPEAVYNEVDRVILRRFIQGKTYREIAEEVCRSEKTVSNRLTEIRKRIPEPDNERLYRRGSGVSQHPRR